MTNFFSFFEESSTFSPGEVIIQEGEVNRDIYILSEGILEISVMGDTGRVVVGEITPPEILGEISFLNGSPRTATVTAKTDVEVFILPYSRVEEEMAGTPVWFRLILRTLTERMKSCDQKIKEYDHRIKELEAENQALRQK